MKTLKTGVLLLFFFSLFSSLIEEKTTKNIVNQSSANPIVDAVLSNNRSNIVQHGMLRPYYNISFAMFCNNPGPTGDTTNIILMDSVSINDTILKPQRFLYLDTTFTSFLAPIVWKVSGTGGFPSFTFVNTDSVPTYTGYGLLPDTIYSDQTLVLSINNFEYADNVQVWLENSQSNQTIKKQEGGTGMVSFTQSDINNISSGGGQVSVVVVLSKYNIQTISGKMFNFINQYSVLKNLTVVFPN